jgi:hypothetical protein
MHFSVWGFRPSHSVWLILVNHWSDVRSVSLWLLMTLRACLQVIAMTLWLSCKTSKLKIYQDQYNIKQRWWELKLLLMFDCQLSLTLNWVELWWECIIDQLWTSRLVNSHPRLIGALEGVDRTRMQTLVSQLSSLPKKHKLSFLCIIVMYMWIL